MLDVFLLFPDLQYNPTTGGMDSGILSADDFTAGIFSSSTSCSSTGSSGGQQMAAPASTSSMMPPPPPPPLPATASSTTTGAGLDFDIDFIDQVIRTPLSSNSGDDVSMEPLASDVAGFLNSIEPPSGVGNSNCNTFNNIYTQPSTTTTTTGGGTNEMNANQVNNNSINNLSFETSAAATSIGDVLGGDEADMMLTTFGGVPCWETAGTL